MQAPYIPAPDALFALWLANFAALITATPTDYGLVSGDATVIQAVADDFAAAYALAINPATRTAPTIADKDTARSSATATVRPYAVTISRNAGVSDSLKLGVGVNLPPTTRTPVPPPTTAPTLSHVASIGGQITIGYSDAATPLSKAKPPGASAMELRMQIGTAVSVSPDDAPLYGLVSKSPVNVATDPGDVGKVATLFGRWRTKSGPAGQSQVGPWSASLATIVL